MRENCKRIGNENFHIELDTNTGCITSIMNPSDEHRMNWCVEDGQWGKIHIVGWRPSEKKLGEFDDIQMKLIALHVGDDCAEATYRNNLMEIKVKRYFDASGRFVENYAIRNISGTVITVNRDNFGIETPFNDCYMNADECMIHRCNTHIWCGHQIAWVNALRMGPSECNLGLYLTKGAIDCYNQDKCTDGELTPRGIFILDPESFFLKSGEEYQIEWVLFWHRGQKDFMEKIQAFNGYIGIEAVHHTVFENESIDFIVKSEKPPEVTCGAERVPVEKTAAGYRAVCHKSAGEYRFAIRAGDKTTWADFCVKIPFADLLEKRINFIIDHQQCRDPESPLYGAFLVYDNDYDSPYFDYGTPDHNACRERMNIPLLMLKYLQFRENEKVRNAMKLYIDFMYREFYDQETGEVFNTIGKNRDQLRLYNAPGVMQILCEMYFVTKDEAYLDDIIRLSERYYAIGGHTCYANGLTIGKIMRAFRMNGNAEKTEKMMGFFRKHVDYIIGNGTSYPKHEVIYEQTIVTPAVNYISEMGALCENREYYIREASTHMNVLLRFSGMQPSFHLKEIAIRFWDDMWFGKGKMCGDTLPHHLSCLTARACLSYGLLTQDRTYIDRAEECVRNCLCLIGNDGRGSAAYIYPYKLDGRRGEFYDPWSNDQDLVLYDALYLSDHTDSFKI